MSRAIVSTPAVSVTGTPNTATPAVIRASSEAHEAVCRQFSGTQTAVPAMPESG